MFSKTNWEIRTDQHWAILGKNGSGKSTIIKAICGRLPFQGQIVYHFQDTVGCETKKTTLPQRLIEFVSFEGHRRLMNQESKFYQARWNSLVVEDSSLVSDYLSGGCVSRTSIFHTQRDRCNAVTTCKEGDEIITQLGIRELLNKRVIQLSNGERRMLLIAKALLRKPMLLILDRPFAGLDEDHTKRLKKILERLMKGHMRLIVAATMLEEIPLGVTHALVLHNYHIISRGTLQKILQGKLLRKTLEERRVALHHCLPKGAGLSHSCNSEAPVFVGFNNVSVCYGHIPVLRKINWTVRRGEHWLVMGENGAGKSTLLSLIYGDNPQAYANEIVLFGKVRGSGESIWDIKKMIGFFSPELHIHFFSKRMSCFEVVCSGFFDTVGLYRSCSLEQKKVASEWIEAVGVGNYQNEEFNSISEGEQRMIMLARVLLKRPVLLLLDEPCQGLDASSRETILSIVDQAVKEFGSTIIYVTHLPEEIPSIITHRLILDHGRVKRKGMWQNKAAKYQHKINCHFPLD